MANKRFYATARGKAAIATIVAMTGAGGMVSIFGGMKVHNDTALAIKFLTQDWEGRRLVAYLDRIPKPPRWTICDGDTTNVRPGMVETVEGCNRRLAVKMERDYRPPLVSCVINWDEQPLSWRGAALDLAWNLGPQGVCRSSSVRKVNDAMRNRLVPDYDAICADLTLFNKSGGRVVRGLKLRREMGDKTRLGEAEICVSGL